MEFFISLERGVGGGGRTFVLHVGQQDSYVDVLLSKYLFGSQKSGDRILKIDTFELFLFLFGEGLECGQGDQPDFEAVLFYDFIGNNGLPWLKVSRYPNQ